MKKNIRSLKELENELVLLKEKQGLQESWFKASLSSIKDSLSPSAIIQNIINKVVTSMLFSGNSEGLFGGSLKSVLLRKVLRFVAGIKSRFGSKG